MGTAKFIREADGFRGDARIYKLDPPYESDYSVYAVEDVVVSAVYAIFSGPEVLVFPYDPDSGEVDFLDVYGERGHYSHEGVLANMGYEVK